MTIERLESQAAAAAVETTMKTASAADVRTSAALRLLALAASLAAAVVVATNRQDRWGITVTFRMLAVWEYRLVSKHWLHHADQLAVNLQAASTAGAGAIGSVAMWGNQPSEWFAVCRLYRLYCDKGAVSLALAFVSFVALGAAATLSRFPARPPPPPPASR
ncbi:CASP-like protein UU-1 [Panicum miliaceum]|uniref:CASP-like protein n=1 Tax=Panicum miliaceum TaxID=4540 RepID=A0A3L6PN71_PANMI|nr:CASP-like protein UU-1 [Panicum miliaceum]